MDSAQVDVFGSPRGHLGHTQASRARSDATRRQLAAESSSTAHTLAAIETLLTRAPGAGFASPQAVASYPSLAAARSAQDAAHTRATARDRDEELLQSQARVWGHSWGLREDSRTSASARALSHTLARARALAHADAAAYTHAYGSMPASAFTLSPQPFQPPAMNASPPHRAAATPSGSRSAHSAVATAAAAAATASDADVNELIRVYASGGAEERMRVADLSPAPRAVARSAATTVQQPEHSSVAHTLASVKRLLTEPALADDAHRASRAAPDATLLPPFTHAVMNALTHTRPRVPVKPLQSPPKSSDAAPPLPPVASPRRVSPPRESEDAYIERIDAATTAYDEAAAAERVADAWLDEDAVPTRFDTRPWPVATLAASAAVKVNVHTLVHGQRAMQYPHVSSSRAGTTASVVVRPGRRVPLYLTPAYTHARLSSQIRADAHRVTLPLPVPKRTRSAPAHATSARLHATPTASSTARIRTQSHTAEEHAHEHGHDEARVHTMDVNADAPHGTQAAPAPAAANRRTSVHDAHAHAHDDVAAAVAAADADEAGRARAKDAHRRYSLLVATNTAALDAAVRAQADAASVAVAALPAHFAARVQRIIPARTATPSPSPAPTSSITHGRLRELSRPRSAPIVQHSRVSTSQPMPALMSSIDKVAHALYGPARSRASVGIVTATNAPVRGRTGGSSTAVTVSGGSHGMDDYLRAHAQLNAYTRQHAVVTPRAPPPRQQQTATAPTDNRARTRSAPSTAASTARSPLQVRVALAPRAAHSRAPMAHVDAEVQTSFLEPLQSVRDRQYDDAVTLPVTLDSPVFTSYSDMYARQRRHSAPPSAHSVATRQVQAFHAGENALLPAYAAHAHAYPHAPTRVPAQLAAHIPGYSSHVARQVSARISRSDMEARYEAIGVPAKARSRSRSQPRKPAVPVQVVEQVTSPLNSSPAIETTAATPAVPAAASPTTTAPPAAITSSAAAVAAVIAPLVARVKLTTQPRQQLHAPPGSAAVSQSVQDLTARGHEDMTITPPRAPLAASAATPRASSRVRALASPAPALATPSTMHAPAAVSTSNTVTVTEYIAERLRSSTRTHSETLARSRAARAASQELLNASPAVHAHAETRMEVPSALSQSGLMLSPFPALGTQALATGVLSRAISSSNTTHDESGDSGLSATRSGAAHLSVRDLSTPSPTTPAMQKALDALKSTPREWKGRRELRDDLSPLGSKGMSLQPFASSETATTSPESVISPRTRVLTSRTGEARAQSGMGRTLAPASVVASVTAHAVHRSPPPPPPGMQAAAAAVRASVHSAAPLTDAVDEEAEDPYGAVPSADSLLAMVEAMKFQQGAYVDSQR